MIRLDAGATSLVGQVRSANEDAMLVAGDVVAVADGMGGHRAGEVASADAVQVLAAMDGHRSLSDLVLAVHLANRRINDRAADDDELRGMGTTVCVVGVVDEEGEHLAVLNVGDSRIYLFAQGELTRLTEDHSLVETLVREGRITPAEAEVHPQRNVVTRALGVEALVVVDAWLLAPCEGDRLLLCSDGLFGEISEDRIRELLAEGDTPEVTARRLAAEADAAGGRDNVTAVVVDVLGADRAPEPVSQRYRRIATPTVDLDDEFRDPHNDTATVPLVTISPPPVGGDAEAAGDGPDDDVLDESSADEDQDEGGGGAAVPAADDPVEPAGDGAEAAAGGDNPAVALDSGRIASADTPAVDPADLGAAPGEHHDDADGVDPGDDESDGDDDQPSWRTPVFVLAVLAVVVLALGIVVWNQNQGWFVGESEDEVVLYKGRPDRFLWIRPRELERFDIEVDLLPQNDVARLERNEQFPTEERARTYIANLELRATTTTTTTTTTAPTTTAPPEQPPPADQGPAPAAGVPADPPA